MTEIATTDWFGRCETSVFSENTAIFSEIFGIYIYVIIFNRGPVEISYYTDWQKKRYNQNQSCFIQAVISSNGVEIYQQNILAVLCFEGISNFVQRYH